MANKVACTATVNNTILTLTPDSNLLNRTKYKVTITTELKSADDADLDQQYESFFKTIESE
jgi:hypothetical protein